MSDLILRSRRVLTPAGIVAATVWIDGSTIDHVAGWSDVPPGTLVQDLGSALVMPGVVDTHVHVNEPGRTEWEGFETATRAAAAGGVTTILDMPLNSIPATTSVPALEAKRAAARAHSLVNVEFIGGLVPGNLADLEAMRDAGVRAFKCYLAPSGVDAFPPVSESDLRDAFPVLARLGLPLMVHAELPRHLERGPDGGSKSYADYMASRPAEAERSAVAMLIRLMERERIPPRVHIVHLSSPSSIPLIHDAKAHGLPLTVETCPHYLSFAAGEIPDAATEFKCAPPIRSDADREGLWDALIAGDIDLIASDHSPCPPSLKETNGDFFAAWGGIASLQFSLAAVWTGARVRGVDVGRIVTWMCEAPAKLAGLARTTASLASGFDADIVVWDPDVVFRVNASSVRHRYVVSPYVGRHLFGVVERTYVGGRNVFMRA